MSRIRFAALCAAAGVAISCSQTIEPPNRRTLERPSAMAFACFGDLRLGDGTIVRSAMPIEACQIRADVDPETGEAGVPPGQEDLQDPRMYGFILQKSTGTLALSLSPIDAPETSSVIDATELSPGENAIPVGTLPVGVSLDPSGCFAITANAGSCDLSRLDVNTAVDALTIPEVSRTPITNAAGERIGARPSNLIGQLTGGTIGAACPAKPQGLVYVTYPDCNLVAAVDAGSGEILGGVQYTETGVTVTDGDVGCASVCGAQLPTDDALPRPGAMSLDEVEGRLYIGADNAAQVTVVDLDATGLPVAAFDVPLEDDAGDLGVTSVAVSEVIGMGGSSGMISGVAGNFQFVYAIATDGTVRVVEVHNLMNECDTQVDPRYLRDVRNIALLSCLPVGDPTTPPRRPQARSPGIHLQGVGRPLDVAFAAADGTSGEDSDSRLHLVGHFAYVTTTSGRLVVVSVDDDNYPDFEDTDAPLEVEITQAIAHQVHDRVGERNAVNDPAFVGASPTCEFPPVAADSFGARLGQPEIQTIIPARLVEEKLHLLPFLRGLLCETFTTDEDTGETDLVDRDTVSEFSFAAPVDVRDAALPDLMALPDQESWSLTWEGNISTDAFSSGVRIGFVAAEGGQTALGDNGAPFCGIGVEPFDIARLAGCNPGGNECGLGEVCFVHPDAPASINTGMCLPEDQTDALTGPCRDVLVSRRRYTVTETHANRLVLRERRRVLRTTPLEGCQSDAQCADLYELERSLGTENHPIDVDLEDDGRVVSCEPDPSRAPGPDRCVMTCANNDGCEDGFVCSSGYCVEGRLPPAECVPTLQRYEIRVGDAFAVTGSETGFLHSRVLDPATGACIDDASAHPLMTGRIPLVNPDCVGDGPTDLTPNPCATTVEHTQRAIVFRFDNGTCEPEGEQLVTRTVPAIRFRNPAFSLNLADPVTAGDAQCNGDFGGTGPAVPVVFEGYQISFLLIAGLTELALSGMRYPAKIQNGPLGGLWIMDEGDINSNIRGQVVRINPAPLAVTSLLQ